MPNILLTRIDNRLVHGQVGVTWTKTIGANLLLVANDEASQDKIQQQLMSVTAKSSGVGIRFFSLEKTAAIIGRAAPNQKIFLLIYNRVVDKMKVVYPFYESVIIKKPKKVNV